jgi:hypothetical protein
MPEQNAPGTPVSTTARTWAAASASRTAAARAVSMGKVSALRFSGRSIVIVATPSAISLRIAASVVRSSWRGAGCGLGCIAWRP